jgi:hypothetical protein
VFQTKFGFDNLSIDRGPQHHIRTYFRMPIRFDLFRFHSPLLTKSRYCFLFHHLLECFRSVGSLPRLRISLLFGQGLDSNSGITGSTTACVSPVLIAACHALLRFLSLGIHHIMFGRNALIISLGSILGIDPRKTFTQNTFSVSGRRLNISPKLNDYTTPLSNPSFLGGVV